MQMPKIAWHMILLKRKFKLIFSINMPTSTAWVILILKYYYVNLKFMLNWMSCMCSLLFYVCVEIYTYVYIHTYNYTYAHTRYSIYILDISCVCVLLHRAILLWARKGKIITLLTPFQDYWARESRTIEMGAVIMQLGFLDPRRGKKSVVNLKVIFIAYRIPHIQFQSVKSLFKDL